MPPPSPNQRRKKREGIVPDAMFELALLYDQERVPGADGTRRRYLFDLKLIHFSSTWYRPSDVLEPGPAGCADRRARRVHDEYVRHAKDLDAKHHAGVADPEGATGDIAVDASMTHWANPIAASSANLADSLAMAVCLIR